MNDNMMTHIVKRAENSPRECNEVAEMRNRVKRTGSALYSREHREMYDLPALIAGISDLKRSEQLPCTD